MTGKYGALVLYEDLAHGADFVERTVPVEELGRQLCQHVVGMNPRRLGSLDDQPSENADDEVRFLQQEFMLDTTVTVADVLQQNRVRILDFARLECGETIALDASTKALELEVDVAR